MINLVLSDSGRTVANAAHGVRFRIYTLLPLREAGRGGGGGAREFVAVCAFWKIRKIIKIFFDTLRSLNRQLTIPRTPRSSARPSLGEGRGAAFITNHRRPHP